MYKMDKIIDYLHNPMILSITGSFIYYLIERFDCYINARKTTSLTRRTIYVFIILVVCTYFISMSNKTTNSPEMLTDMGNF
jgi:hypothetical protein